MDSEPEANDHQLEAFARAAMIHWVTKILQNLFFDQYREEKQWVDRPKSPVDSAKLWNNGLSKGNEPEGLLLKMELSSKLNRYIKVAQDLGPDQLILSYTFLGTYTDAPTIPAVFHDAEKRLDFYAFSVGNVNAILHRES